VADTLRADRVGARRSGPTLTPVIDGLAAGGATFENASSTASWDLPTTASILTGLYPSDHGLQRRTQRIRPEAIGLAPLLRDAGYETAAIVADRGITAEAGFARGFDLWDDTGYSEGVQRHLGTPMATALRRLGLCAPRDGDTPAGGVVDRALNWLRGTGNRPFFLYLHLMDPHAPYAPPPPYDTMYGDGAGASLRMVPGTLEAIMDGQLRVEPEDFDALVALYDGEVSYMDSKIGDLLGGLKSMGRMESTLIVFTSDQGEELIDHGGLGHAHTLYQELVHVPLVLSGPGIAAGSVLDGNVSQVDLAPTILEAVGLTPPAPMDGVSLWGALSRNEPVPARDIFMEETYTGQRSLVHAIRAARRGNLKIIGSSFHARGEGPWDWALYDLEADPKESTRLEGTQPEVAREMIGAAEEWMARRSSQGDGGSPAPSSR
ncbi:MAG TPA: sulfatase, partial [Candidatus Saccharimonadales bacterium]|nr:sulfatase [Candidatus Saccharimonadales bacterium]